MADHDQPRSSGPKRARVPVASIGASAGGITALQAFFEALPQKVGAAFVVIVHLDPEHASELPRIIAARAKMPVVQVTGDHAIEADKIYVIPPNRRLLVSTDHISSAEFEEPRGQRAPIDQFFRSVADQHGDGFAIILTGAGSDGAVGVKAVKEAGGLILVQDPNEAEYPSMPRNAIASGVADFVLPVREIAARIPELVRNKEQLAGDALTDKDDEAFRRVLAHLRLKSGHDFSHYKRSTVVRRIARRMQVTRTETLEDYLAHLRKASEEAQALLADLLISVTSFFRDAAAFQQLARDVIPRLFEERDAHSSVRVWVPGCATGEEVYSIAILLLEEAARREERPELQVFASDLDAGALATAREGSYPLAIQADVSEERLRKFFVREGDHYRIRREVRDLIVFAPHSLLRDPPFSHIDLVSCRNLLIYLDRELQHQVCSTFHYALRRDGYLFVGSSETIDNQSLFRVLNRDARIFQALPHARELPPLPRVVTGPVVYQSSLHGQSDRRAKGNYPSEHRQALEHLAPPSMLVDDAHRIINVSESAGRYLLQPAGPPTNVAGDLVRPELRLDLQTGLHRAFEQDEATLTLPVAVRFNGVPQHVGLHVRPYLREGTSRSALVLFLEGGPAPAKAAQTTEQDDNSSQLVTQLRNELLTTQTHLRTSREQYDTVTEELRASNEELQSINEEYRSTAEELETSKEELQSINEELQTLNHELKLKLDAVSRGHNDLQNLMSSTDVGTLFLTTDLRIHRFTPRLTDIFNVAPGDEGRPIADFTHRLEYGDLTRDSHRVLADLAPLEHTIKSSDGKWFLMRLRPYRTVENKIDGVVITFVDVTERQQAEKRWQERQQILLNELAHRVKNTLAIVQAIVGQTLRSGGVEAGVRETVNARLEAVAKSHDLLLSTEWRGAELGTIVREQLAAHLSANPSRIHIDGPPVQLPTQVATAFALLVHELATNAAKYGALSEPHGQVTVRWELLGGGAGRRVKTVWKERGGPRVQPPASSGFGSYLVEHGLPEGRVEREFRPEGVICTVELPLPSGAARKSW
jgi:two-component system, chemotaxis family, CheB/CheR fusion protein